MPRNHIHLKDGQMRAILSTVAGLIMAAAFPPFSYYPLITAALLPLLYSAGGKGWKSGFRYGFITGFTFFAVLIWWIAPAISVYGRMPWFAAWPVMILLACYLALFYGIWSGLWGVITSRDSFDSTTWRILTALSMAGAWVALEWIRGELILGGFPWGAAAYALAPVPSMIQGADICGVYGLSFFIILINICLFYIFCPGDNDSRTALRTVSLGVIISVTGLNYSYGILKEQNLVKNSGKPIFTAALQGSFPQDIKWNYEIRDLTLSRYKKLGADVNMASSDKDIKPGLFVWPETSIPFYFQEEGVWKERVLSIVKGYGAATVAGSQAYEYNAKGNITYLNSAYMIAPTGRVTGRYDKAHLVPFGEYLPLEGYIGWVRKYMPTAGHFSSGTHHAPLVSGEIRAGIQICFESIFPDISRRAVLKGANILVVITNDAWFGRTGAPFQHADMAVFRAVETGRWLVRSANTGISSIISPSGKVVEHTAIFVPAAIGHMAELRENRTFYVKHGNKWVILTCLILTSLQLLGIRDNRQG